MAKMTKARTRAKPYKWESNVIEDAAGNVLDRQDRMIYRTPVNTDKFAFSFLTGLDILAGVGKMEARVFCQILALSKYDTGEFGANVRVKQAIGQSVGLSERSVYHAIANLVKAGLMLRSGMMDYRLHPRHFWIGTLEARNAALRALDEKVSTPLRDFYDDQPKPDDQ